MKKIIPFKKEVIFKTNIYDITSISLEHELKIDHLNIGGEFIVSGEYKISESSKTTEPFKLNIPFEIVIDDIFDTSDANCDIDDFYYEIKDDKILSISIDVCVDKLKEKLIDEKIPNLEIKKDIIEELFEEDRSEINELNKLSKNENKVVEAKIIDDSIISKDSISTVSNNESVTVKEYNDKNELNISTNKNISLFSHINEEENYVSYTVYIIRDGDTIESISDKYSIELEEINKYNNISDLKIGDKLIIPYKYERN